METFIAAAAVIVIAIFGMCFNIIFKKGGEFPKYDVGSNEEMRKRGIKCARQEEEDRKKINLKCDGACSNCRETECR